MIAQGVDELDGALQLDAARLLETCIELRQKVTAALEPLVERVPEEHKALVAAAIAALSGGGEDDIAALTEALAGALPAEVESLLEAALAQATEAVQQAVEQLEELAPLAGQLGADLTELQTQLQQLLEQLLSPPSGSPRRAREASPRLCRRTCSSYCLASSAEPASSARIASFDSSSGDSPMTVAARSNPASASASGSARSVPSP